MTNIYHPHNKFERKLVEEKHTLINEKVKERAGRVRRKLLTEQAKEKEISDDLQDYISTG